MLSRAKNLSETEELAREFTGQLRRQEKKDGALVVGLSGDLGAGKTAFVKGMGKALGIEESVTSPTFVIEKVYILRNQEFSRLIHIDAYRIESPREMEALRFKDLLKDPTNLIVIEWVEKIESLLPPHFHRIALSFIDESVRDITVLHGKN